MLSPSLSRNTWITCNIRQFWKFIVIRIFQAMILIMVGRDVFWPNDQPTFLPTHIPTYCPTPWILQLPSAWSTSQRHELSFGNNYFLQTNQKYLLLLVKQARIFETMKDYLIKRTDWVIVRCLISQPHPWKNTMPVFIMKSRLKK